MPNALGFPNCSLFLPLPLSSTEYNNSSSAYSVQTTALTFDLQDPKRNAFTLLSYSSLSLRFSFPSVPFRFAFRLVAAQCASASLLSLHLDDPVLGVETSASLCYFTILTGFFHGTSMSISFFFFFLALFYPLVSLPSPDNKSMTGER